MVIIPDRMSSRVIFDKVPQNYYGTDLTGRSRTTTATMPRRADADEAEGIVGINMEPDQQDCHDRERDTTGLRREYTICCSSTTPWANRAGEEADGTPPRCDQSTEQEALLIRLLIPTIPSASSCVSSPLHLP